MQGICHLALTVVSLRQIGSVHNKTMAFKKLFALIFFALAGYLIGRWSHAYLNDLVGNPAAPHHWIYGALLMILGIALRKRMIGKLMFTFGLGLFASDLIDFFHFRLLSPDAPGPKRF